MFSFLIAHFADAAPCKPSGSFLGLPTWYSYLPGVTDPVTGHCSPSIAHLSDIWLIVAAITEILLRLAALIAVIMVIVGGVSYITSQGDPNKTKQALNTIINSLIGLVISVAAATIVTFIAGRFS